MRNEAFIKNGRYRPRRIAASLRTTLDEIARAAGLDRDAVRDPARIAGIDTQRRLREMVGILNRATPRLGSAHAAYAWYRSEPLSGFHGLTAMQLVCEGRAAEVQGYIDAVEAGIHA